MPTDRRLALAVGLDAFVVVLFVAIGRRNHEEGTALGGVLRTAAPFLIGLLAGWVLMTAWRRPWSIIVGVGVWAITLLIGMSVRRLVFDDGTALAFVIVATLFLAAGLIGWRGAAALVVRRTGRQPSGGSLSAR